MTNAEFHRIYKAKAKCSAGKANGLTQLSKTRFSGEEICLLCTLFGFSPTAFGWPENAFLPEPSVAGSGHPQDTVFSNESAVSGGKDQSDYIQQFFEAINRFLLQTERSLFVCDYIAARQGIKQKAPLEQYFEQDRLYFSQIEKRLAGQQFQYHRIIQLPLGSAVRNLNEALELVAEELLPDTFAHLCRCLRDHPELCHFYVVIHPFRLYTYYVVDQQTILTEYPRFDKSGVPVPDLLFVNHSSPDNPEAIGSRYIRSCLLEFRRMAEAKSNHRNRLTRTSLFEALQLLNKKLSAELDLLESQGKGDFKNIATDLSGNWTESSLGEIGRRDQQINELRERLGQIRDKLEIGRQLYSDADE